MTKRRAEIARCLGRNTAFPVALISTTDNIITVAMIHYFQLEPLWLGVGLHPHRHTFGLLRAERAFVVNLPRATDVEWVTLCGHLSGRDVDKFERCGLTRQPASEIPSSLIAECPVNIECRLVREIELPERTWFVGEVVACHEEPGYDPSQAMVYLGAHYRAVGPITGRR